MVSDCSGGGGSWCPIWPPRQVVIFRRKAILGLGAMTDEMIAHGPWKGMVAKGLFEILTPSPQKSRSLPLCPWRLFFEIINRVPVADLIAEQGLEFWKASGDLVHGAFDVLAAWIAVANERDLEELDGWKAIQRFEAGYMEVAAKKDPLNFLQCEFRP
ncbi:hypothetical protein K402DRAFT_275209 [Aulographum hederae CBS 113979]|uniref:Uncharacterized protein n=1 Tax=Aulographum hederae CBS 113979 TaxID=1176131 RepID=A0A6G1GIX6_9PEZI|nr:hypothetical protein K402DRAFT_275209 [Aulographum hederae CBS 113979]